MPSTARTTYVPKSKTPKSAPAPKRPYHHGDLHAALLAEAEKIVERDGIDALTLRAAARAAGVSHAAPANHFGDLRGLITELGASAFRRFSASLAEAVANAATPQDTFSEIGRAYVAFARKHPGLFDLMFRAKRFDMESPVLHEAMIAARTPMTEALIARSSDFSPGQVAVLTVACWSLVHGFAMLLLDNRLAPILGGPLKGTTPEALLDEVMEVTQIVARAAAKA